MKLLSLSLKGFRQHKNTLIEFKTGLSGIIGTNGSGKSTLIEAIAFCFYGSKAIRGKLEQLRTIGLGPKDEVRASLIFEHENNTYRIERTLTDAQLYTGGESEPYIRGNIEVVDKITSLFRMNYEEFTATFFTEQKGLEFLSGKKGAADRERFIVRLMGYDKLQEIQELLRSDKKDKKSSILAWESSLGDRSKILETIASEDKEMQLVNEKHEEASQLLKNSESEVEKNKKSYESLHNTYVEYAKLKQKISTLQVRYDEKGSRIKSLEATIKDLENKSLNITDIFAKLVSGGILIKETDHLENFSRLIDAEVVTVRNSMDQVKIGLNELKTSHLSKELSLKADINSIKSQIELINVKNKNLLKLKNDSPCPTCGQELGDTLLAVKNNIGQEIEDLNSKLSIKTSELSALQPDQLAETELNTRLHELNNKIQTLTNAAKLTNELSYQEKEKQSLKNQIEAIRQELEEIQNNIISLRESLTKLNFSEDEYNSKKVQYETCQRLLEIARLQRLKIEGELDKHKALLERSRQSLLEYDEKSAILEKSRSELVLLEKSDQILTDLRKYLNAQLRPRLSQIASEYLAELSDGRYNNVEIAQDFTPRVVEDGEVKSVISGGEEDLLNLCLRLALSSMLAERAGMTFSTLILDEVFGALDDNRRNNVLILFEKLSKRFEQIIVITHLEDIREGVHNLISVNYNEALAELEIVDQLKYLEQNAVVNI